MNQKKYFKDYWASEDGDRVRRNYYQNRYDSLKKFMQVGPQDMVLDVGGGNGQFLQYMKVKPHCGVVMDTSPSGLAFARSLGYKGTEGDAERRFPFQEDSFDAVFCMELLEHLLFPNKTLSEINNVLKRGGVLYVAVPNMKPGGYHVRRYKLGELKEDLKKCGFRVVWSKFVPAFHSWDRDRMASRLARCLSYLPLSVRRFMARAWPRRFALMFVMKAVRESQAKA